MATTLTLEKYEGLVLDCLTYIFLGPANHRRFIRNMLFPGVQDLFTPYALNSYPASRARWLDLNRTNDVTRGKSKKNCVSLRVTCVSFISPRRPNWRVLRLKGSRMGTPSNVWGHDWVCLKRVISVSQKPPN